MSHGEIVIANDGCGGGTLLRSFEDRFRNVETQWLISSVKRDSQNSFIGMCCSVRECVVLTFLQDRCDGDHVDGIDSNRTFVSNHEASGLMAYQKQFL